MTFTVYVTLDEDAPVYTEAEVADALNKLVNHTTRNGLATFDAADFIVSVDSEVYFEDTTELEEVS